MSDVQIMVLWLASKFVTVQITNTHAHTHARSATLSHMQRIYRNIETVIKNKHISCRLDFYLFLHEINYLFILLAPNFSTPSDLAITQIFHGT